MTYAINGLGAYYADTPGFELPFEAAAGFGSVNLSASEMKTDLAIWAAYQNVADPDAKALAASTANAASRRLANRIRAALAQLGFGPDVLMDAYWGTGPDCAAYELFLGTMGLARAPGPCGGVSPAQVDVLAAEVAKQNAGGPAPGPLAVVEYHETSPGTFARGPAPGQKPLAGSSKSLAGFGILAFVALGVGAYLIFRKKPLVHYKQTTTTYKNNPHRRRRRRHHRRR